MYTLRFPFLLLNGNELDITEQSIELDGLKLLMQKPKNSPYYVMTIEGFQSEDAAVNYIGNVWAGLMWTLLCRGVFTKAHMGLKQVEYCNDPRRARLNFLGFEFQGTVDGLINGAHPAVYPTQKIIRSITMNLATLRVSTPGNDVLTFFKEGATFPNSSEVIKDDKLRVAMELYGAYYPEVSANARFLTLVMALETLAISTPRPQRVLDLMQKWDDEITEVLSEENLEPDVVASLEGLKRTLFFRRNEESIRQQIRSLVQTTLGDDNDNVETARTAVEMYDHRSKLVHDGILPPNVLTQVTAKTKIIVERVLKVKFRQIAERRE